MQPAAKTFWLKLNIPTLTGVKLKFEKTETLTKGDKFLIATESFGELLVTYQGRTSLGKLHFKSALGNHNDLYIADALIVNIYQLISSITQKN